jgi:inosine-uridine nucleoside N-ribohydrolase
MTPILFDTDPGIDDAMALLMLARDPLARLVGIGTVFGNASVQTTSANALALAERFGIDVPVAAGAARPLQRPPRAHPVAIHGRDGLGDVGLLAPARARRLDPRPAPVLIADLAREHDGALVIVAVGPLTNLALALQRDPGLPRRVRRVVVMGGAFGHRGHAGNATPLAEANVFCDPHAADLVFGAPWPVAIVGLDVTHEVRLDPAWLDALGQHGGDAGRFVRAITRGYEAFYRARTGGGIYAHDASAVACALRPQRFAMRGGAVRVQADDGPALGQTVQARPGRPGSPAGRDERPQQQVCIEVDADGVRADFGACFGC